MAATEDLHTLTRKLGGLVSSLQRKGILNEFFNVTYNLKYESDNPTFFLDTATTFISDTETVIRDLKGAIDRPALNYHDISELNIKLKGSSSSLGLRNITLGCADLASAVNDHSREGCIWAVERLHREYKGAKNALGIILDLERKIISQKMDES